MKTQIVGTDSEATSPTAEEVMADLDGSSKRDIIGVAKRDQADQIGTLSQGPRSIIMVQGPEACWPTFEPAEICQERLHSENALPAHHGSDVGRAFSVTQVLIVPRLARYLCLHTSSHPLSTLPPRLSRALPKDLPGCQLGLLRSRPP